MMRGASADALVDLGEVLGKARTLADAATTGEELFGAATVLRGDPALRRVVTDGSVQAEAKEGLVETIFGSALSETPLKVLTAAVRRRWTSSHDLADALEHLAVVSTVRSAGKDGPLVGDELFAVRRLTQEHPELRSALSDFSRSIEDRTDLLQGLLKGHTLPATSVLVTQAVRLPRPVDVTLERFLTVAAEALDETVATVHTARELTTAEQERLTAALSKQYDTTVQLHVVLDPELVGGVRVEIRHDVIDGTVVGRLDDARRRLAG